MFPISNTTYAITFLIQEKSSEISIGISIKNIFHYIKVLIIIEYEKAFYYSDIIQMKIVFILDTILQNENMHKDFIAQIDARLFNIPFRFK